MKTIQTLTTFTTSEHLHELFRSGKLLRHWASAYQMLFDADDVRVARNQARYGYHFHEWLAAILLFHTQGLLSLVKKYPYKSHTQKYRILQRLVTPQTLAFFQSRAKGNLTQCPDLLVYAPDFSDWFFCEVKGPRDKLRLEQEIFFEALSQTSGKPVFLIELHES